MDSKTTSENADSLCHFWLVCVFTLSVEAAVQLITKVLPIKVTCKGQKLDLLDYQIAWYSVLSQICEFGKREQDQVLGWQYVEKTMQYYEKYWDRYLIHIGEKS